MPEEVPYGNEEFENGSAVGDPFVEFERLAEEFDRVFGLNGGLSGARLLDRSITPALDLQETPEVWAGEFRRTLSLPPPVDADSVTTTLTDGILTVVLPKPEEAKPKRISITARQSGAWTGRSFCAWKCRA